MVEGNDDDSEEREEDEEYFPDEDSTCSEEEASSTSGFSDEEYTPTSNRTVKPPRRKFATQLLVQGELSEYEKIRATNIKEKKKLQRTLQGEWQEGR